jgi:hypothetical protein
MLISARLWVPAPATASSPSITGRSPPGPAVPRTTIG